MIPADKFEVAPASQGFLIDLPVLLRLTVWVQLLQRNRILANQVLFCSQIHQENLHLFIHLLPASRYRWDLKPNPALSEESSKKRWNTSSLTLGAGNEGNYFFFRFFFFSFFSFTSAGSFPSDSLIQALGQAGAEGRGDRRRSGRTCPLCLGPRC